LLRLGKFQNSGLVTAGNGVTGVVDDRLIDASRIQVFHELTIMNCPRKHLHPKSLRQTRGKRVLAGVSQKNAPRSSLLFGKQVSA